MNFRIFHKLRKRWSKTKTRGTTKDVIFKFVFEKLFLFGGLNK